MSVSPTKPDVPLFFSARHSALNDSLQRAPPFDVSQSRPYSRRTQSVQHSTGDALLRHARTSPATSKANAPGNDESDMFGVSQPRLMLRRHESTPLKPKDLFTPGYPFNGVIDKQSMIDKGTQTLAPTTVAIRPHIWISMWLAFTIPLIFWDATLYLMRPRHAPVGDLHWIWKGYASYKDIDLVQGVVAYARGNAFASALALLNLAENAINIHYLYLAHRTHSHAAPLVGLASSVMALSKTLLSLALEYYCGYCSVGPTNFTTLLLFWLIPNAVWVVVPVLVIRRLSQDILHLLEISSTRSSHLITRS